LKLTGPEGVKEFLQIELGNFMGGKLFPLAGSEQTLPEKI
jgi:hypothetical protein